MSVVKIFQHKNISDKYLLDAAKIKCLRWNYSKKEHLIWMMKNLSENDYHLLVYADNNLIGYANLVDIIVIINEENVNLRGIGNVCTLETGRGFGNILMEEVNFVLSQNQWKGILLCKDNLVPYYEKFDWKLLKNANGKNKELKNTNILFFNMEEEITSFDYKDRNF